MPVCFSSFIPELITYLKCPSVSADPSYQAGMEGAQSFLINFLTQIGFTCEKVKTDLHPVILAKRCPYPDKPHVLIYGHYDVQPADPIDLWHTPAFEPHIIGDKIYARGAADNKGPLMAHLAAVAILLKQNPHFPLNITFMIEGEEEIGSPSFLNFLKERQSDIQADFVFLSDTQSPSKDQIAITTALRGLFTLELELRGPKMDLHSGMHGGAVRNPIQALVQLLSTLHTDEGWVNIPGFYDAVLPPTDFERSQLSLWQDQILAYQADLGVPSLFCPPGYSPIEGSRFLPTLEYNGISGGYQGTGSKTIIPSTACVKISVRLVGNQQAAVISNLLIQTLADRLPSGVVSHIELGGAGEPYVVYPPHHPQADFQTRPQLKKAFKTIDEATKQIMGKPPVYLAEGGSIPIIQSIRSITGMDALMLGLSLPDSYLHAPNENADLGFLDHGCRIIQKVLEKVADERDSLG